MVVDHPFPVGVFLAFMDVSRLVKLYPILVLCIRPTAPQMGPPRGSPAVSCSFSRTSVWRLRVLHLPFSRVAAFRLSSMCFTFTCLGLIRPPRLAHFSSDGHRSGHARLPFLAVILPLLSRQSQDGAQATWSPVLWLKFHISRELVTLANGKCQTSSVPWSSMSLSTNRLPNSRCCLGTVEMTRKDACEINSAAS